MKSLAVYRLLIYCLIQSCYAIQLEGNGYEDIVVFIGDSIPEDLLLLRKIEEWLTEASEKLYMASRYHVFLRKITIRIPQTWSTKSNYQSVSQSEGSKSDIIIDDNEDAIDDKPYTLGQTGCGREAMFTVYTPGIIRQGNTGNYGNLGILFIHEWGHFRWGLFDEYASAKDNKNNLIEFYLENGKFEPVRCTVNVTGVNRKSIYQLCALDRTGKPEQGCRFYPNRDSTSTARGSIMGHSFIPSVDQFCDSKGNQQSPNHNDLAPNLQNIHCNGKSAWDVMRQHNDFKVTTPGVKSADTKPTFTYIQPNNVDRISLVIDVSGSMSAEILYARSALVSLIKLVIPEGTYLSIVTFSNVAHLKKSLTKISSEEDRENLANALPSVATGGTSIGSGVKRAIKEFRDKQGSYIRGNIIYLTTDGKDGDKILQEIMPDIIQSGVIIHTLAIGANADGILSHIANSTGGFRYFYSTNTQNSTALIDALSEPFTQGTTNKIIKIQSKNIAQNSGKPYQGEFFIDDSIGNDTVIQFTGRNVEGVRLTVTTPSGKNITEVGKDSNQGVIVVKLPGTAKVGGYKIHMSSDKGSTIQGTLGVQSKPQDLNKGVIKVKSWTKDADCAYSATMRCPVYASVLKGYKPVSNADVTVVIENDAGFSAKLKLRDNGIGADIVKDDGIYSAYILANIIKSSGRHSVKAIVKGDNATITSSFSGAAQSDIGKGKNKGKILSPFMRTGISQAFIVKNYVPSKTPDVDNIPPSAITTLALQNIDDEKKFTLSWKAVGDDFDTGQAHSYDIRISKNHTDLIRNPDEQETLQNNIVPKPPGDIEHYVVNLYNKSDENTTYFVAVRAKDDNHLIGHISNIVSLSIFVEKSWPAPLDTEPVDGLGRKHSVDATQQTPQGDTSQQTMFTDKPRIDTSKRTINVTSSRQRRTTLPQYTTQQTPFVNWSENTATENNDHLIFGVDTSQHTLLDDTSQQTFSSNTSEPHISIVITATSVGILIIVLVAGIAGKRIYHRRKIYVIKDLGV